MIRSLLGFTGVLSICCGLFLMSGCKSEAVETSSNPDAAAEGAVNPSAIPPVADEPPTPAPAGQVEEEMEEVTASVRLLDWEETQELIASKKGKVVVVDLWSTYCPPCIVEFPHLVKLHQELGDQVKCISVSVDYEGLEDKPVETYVEKIQSFLQRQGASFDNVLLTTSSETVFNEKIEHHSIPVVYVYNQQGELAGQFPDPQNPGEFTYSDHVIPLVKNLLAN